MCSCCYIRTVLWSFIADAAMYIVGAKTKLRAMMIAYLLHCTVPFYIVGAFAAVSIVTAVMFHSCVVCAVTARLRAMIIVYSTVRRLFFFCSSLIRMQSGSA